MDQQQTEKVGIRSHTYQTGKLEMAFGFIIRALRYTHTEEWEGNLPFEFLPFAIRIRTVNFLNPTAGADRL